MNTSPTYPLIYNPASGGAGERRARRAIRALESLGCRVEALPTSGVGSATSLARRAAKREVPRLLAAGGDGTINEVVNGLAGSDTELAIIPTGTANVLAMELGVPLKIPDACRLACEGDSVRVDLGLAGDRYFTLMAGVGFDALVIKNVNPVLKKSIRRAAFPVTGLVTFIQQDLPLLQVSAAGREVEGYFVIVSNSRYYGGKFGPAPEASMTDGRLDVCVLKGKGLQEMLNFWVAALRQSHVDSGLADYFQAEEVWISCPGGDPVPVQTDGEIIGELPLKVTVAPAALRVCAGRVL